MLFASDLDQTLIYSTRSFRLGLDMDAPPHGAVEIYKEQEISFMTDSARERLRRLSKQMDFVPVTTRTVEQYQRISLFQTGFTPPYAIVSNGGNILVQGRVDEAWNRQIQSKVEQQCLCSYELLAEFQKIQHESWVLSGRQADRLFHYFIVERTQVPTQELTEFMTWATQNNWSVSLQGRKLYLVPAVVNKWDAVAYVKEQLQQTYVAAAGDSLLDLCVLTQADFAVAPCHGEIWDNRDKLSIAGLRFTARAGLVAAEDILELVEQVKLQNETSA